MTQINKAQRGAILQFGKLVNKAKLASNRLGRIFTGEAAAEKKLNKLAKQKILQQTQLFMISYIKKKKLYMVFLAGSNPARATINFNF